MGWNNVSSVSTTCIITMWWRIWLVVAFSTWNEHLFACAYAKEPCLLWRYRNCFAIWRFSWKSTNTWPQLCFPSGHCSWQKLNKWTLESLKWCCFCFVFCFPSSDSESWEGIAYYLPLGQRTQRMLWFSFFFFNLWEQGVSGTIIINIWHQVPCQWEVAPAAVD